MGERGGGGGVKGGVVGNDLCGLVFLYRTLADGVHACILTMHQT